MVARKELDLTELLVQMITRDYQFEVKNLRVAVQASLVDLLSKGTILKSQDRKYSIKFDDAAT